jgi:hypothetical protein
MVCNFTVMACKSYVLLLVVLLVTASLPSASTFNQLQGILCGSHTLLYAQRLTTIRILDTAKLCAMSSYRPVRLLAELSELGTACAAACISNGNGGCCPSGHPRSTNKQT